MITGAATGIGRATALRFASAGWRCLLVDHNEAALRQTWLELPTVGAEPHLTKTVDLTDPGQITRLGEALPELDAILNNAGMSDSSQLPLAEQTTDQLSPLLALNLAAPAAVVDASLHKLKPGARIVNVASGAGLHAIPWRGAYSPSKAGLIAQTRALAEARPDLCVTVLAPGFVRTELVERLIAAGRLNPVNAVNKIPFGRMGTPLEMAQAHFFLASTGAKPISGQILAVNGGSSIFGGSQRFAPTEWDSLPSDAPLRLEVVGVDEAWKSLDTTDLVATGYPARLDLSSLTAGAGGVLQAVHVAGARFVARHPNQGSLTLLLPSARSTRWQDAGDLAAARMMVSTFACEWGVHALRINALEVPPDVSPSSLYPLLRFLCGPASQYVTGQTLVVSP